jgi:hypothetical protein
MNKVKASIIEALTGLCWEKGFGIGVSEPMENEKLLRRSTILERSPLIQELYSGAVIKWKIFTSARIENMYCTIYYRKGYRKAPGWLVIEATPQFATRYHLKTCIRFWEILKQSDVTIYGVIWDSLGDPKLLVLP